MTRQTGNFDNVARIYDGLSRLVFGSSIRDAQTCFLSEIKSGGTILVLGGGTGWLLEELGKLNGEIEVWYIDASAEMIRLSKEREPNFPVHFIQGTHEQIPQQAFDVVITHFFLDLFTEQELMELIPVITAHCRAGSIWLVADFQDGGKWWQRAMLSTMYAFFRITSSVSVGKLSRWERFFPTGNWRMTGEKTWKAGFIRSVAFRLSDTP